MPELTTTQVVIIVMLAAGCATVALRKVAWIGDDELVPSVATVARMRVSVRSALEMMTTRPSTSTRKRAAGLAISPPSHALSPRRPPCRSSSVEVPMVAVMPIPPCSEQMSTFGLEHPGRPRNALP